MSIFLNVYLTVFFLCENQKITGILKLLSINFIIVTKEMVNKKILENLAGNSLAEEIDRDIKATSIMLDRVKDAQKAHADKKIIKQEQESADVYKRALTLIGASGVTATSPDGTTKPLSENGMPVSSYLGHGARVMIQIPPNSGNMLFNWLTSGDKEKSGASRLQTQQGAIDENKIVYNRTAATHAIDVINTEEGTKKTRELKGFKYGAKDYLGNKLLGKKTQHWGVDLAMGNKFNDKDAEGNIVAKPDGEHGHLYIYYKPPTKTDPGAILIGNEGASPHSSKHSKTGASDPISPTGGSMWQDLHAKLAVAGEKEFQKTIIPKKYNGLIARPDIKTLEQITNLKSDQIENIGSEIASRIPGKNPEDFLEKPQLYVSPNYMPSKKLEEPQKPSKPNLLKVIVNYITFKKVFTQEIEDYNKDNAKYMVDKKKYESAQKIIAQDQNRKKTENHNKDNLEHKVTNIKSQKLDIMMSKTTTQNIDIINKKNSNLTPNATPNKTKNTTKHVKKK